MKKTKTITRTWMTKSGLKTKTYTYGIGKSRRGKVLITKSGKRNEKNIQAFKDEIHSNTEYTAAEKRALEADLNIILKQREKTGKRLTTTGFLGELSDTKISRMLINAGYSVEEAATELGVTEKELLNTKNWNNDIFVLGSLAYRFKFGYTGSVFTKV